MDELEQQVENLVKFSNFKGKVIISAVALGLFGYVVFLFSCMDLIDSFVNSYFGV